MEAIHEIKVSVTAQDDSHALAEARNHQLALNIKKGSGDARVQCSKDTRWLPLVPAS